MLVFAIDFYRTQSILVYFLNFSRDYYIVFGTRSRSANIIIALILGVFLLLLWYIPLYILLIIHYPLNYCLFVVPFFTIVHITYLIVCPLLGLRS
ncbi:hypothetical protein M501DRAFT_269337 [Patellaria atrata CBS 101060]|uniref:Uncharacterized protein n=1 Tax=Patellaria atrata CBS 101060 TaxID=1346257 RepID=A0A9P4S5P1_9PEZI|nr:hypothetical protein M501DRAFT_269337 [Patellaria atrata CBS 101060]